MTDTAIAPERRGYASRMAALAVCILMFAVYYALLHAVIAYGAPLMHTLNPPANAPAAWWRVDKNVVLVGTADLAAGILPVWIYYLIRRRSFADLGFNRPGTVLSWLLVLAVQALIIWADTHMGALGHASGAMNSYAIFASVFVGPAAAFAEETLFRGFMMEELHRGGFSVLAQIAISMILFGLAHLSYAVGPYGWTVPVFTGILGGFWSFIYILGKRSLWPSIVAHIVNDAILIPSVFYLMIMRH